jgi:hypothetical protein
MPEVEDLFKYIKDMHGLDDARRVFQGVKSSPVGDALGPVSTFLDSYNMTSGSLEMGSGVSDGDGVEFLDGLHDFLDGGSGLLGNAPGPVGAAAKAFNAGFTIGDYAAPIVFNDVQERTEAPSEDGEYHAHTGNETIDGTIDGARMISDGNYVDGGVEIADSVLDGAEAMGIPGAGMLSTGVDVARFLL